MCAGSTHQPNSSHRFSELQDHLPKQSLSSRALCRPARYAGDGLDLETRQYCLLTCRLDSMKRFSSISSSMNQSSNPVLVADQSFILSMHVFAGVQPNFSKISTRRHCAMPFLKYGSPSGDLWAFWSWTVKVACAQKEHRTGQLHLKYT